VHVDHVADSGRVQFVPAVAVVGENGGAGTDLVQQPDQGHRRVHRAVLGRHHRVEVEQHRVMAARVDDDRPQLAHDQPSHGD
jgi:hypothetical protein